MQCEEKVWNIITIQKISSRFKQNIVLYQRYDLALSSGLLRVTDGVESEKKKLSKQIEIALYSVVTN